MIIRGNMRLFKRYLNVTRSCFNMASTVSTQEDVEETNSGAGKVRC